MANQSLTHSYNKKAPLVGAFILSMQDSTIDPRVAPSMRNQN